MLAVPPRGAALQELDVALGRVAAWYGARLPGVLGYRPVDLAHRLTQRFAQLRQSRYALLRSAPGAPADCPARLDLGGYSIAAADGSIRIAAGTALSLLFEFALRWCYTAFAILGALAARSRGERVTLAYGIGQADLGRGGDDAVFMDYCAKGPIEPLREGDRLVLQVLAAPKRSAGWRTVYARYPLHAYLRLSGLPLPGMFRLMARHVATLSSALLLFLRQPAALLLARDLAEDAPARHLDEAGAICAVVFTNSNYTSQPLWMWAPPGRRLRCHMVWYSKNVRPFLTGDDPDFPVHPARRLIRADTMWIWMAPFGDYLRSIGLRSEMRVVGPILWYLPGAAPRIAPAEAQVAIFDIEAVTAEAIRNLELLDSYYTHEVLGVFLTDVVEAADRAAARLGKPIRVVLKHKRRRLPVNDARYFDLVDALAARYPQLALVPPETSVYDVVAQSQLVIGAPFTSPVYVASHMGKASLYYDPTGKLRPTFDPAPGLAFAASRAQLDAALDRIFMAASQPPTLQGRFA